MYRSLPPSTPLLPPEPFEGSGRLWTGTHKEDPSPLVTAVTQGQASRVYERRGAIASLPSLGTGILAEEGGHRAWG